jgi:hypothetical protein
MKIIDPKQFLASHADTATDLIDIMLEEDDGTVRIDLGDGLFAGMQLADVPDILDDDLDQDDWAFYDFLLDENEGTVQFDEQTTGIFSLEQIVMLVEYRLGKLQDHFE